MALASPIEFRLNFEEKQSSFSSNNFVADVPVDLEINFENDLRIGKIYSKSMGKTDNVDNLNKSVNKRLNITYINGG